MGQSSKNFN